MSAPFCLRVEVDDSDKPSFCGAPLASKKYCTQHCKSCCVCGKPSDNDTCEEHSTSTILVLETDPA